MGEQVNKEEPKKEEEKVQQKVAEEGNKSEAPPPLPSPFVLYIDLHCVGCAKKIEKILTKMKGIEAVVIDMVQNQVTLKGLVDAQAICNEVMKKTKRMAKVMSPLPASPDAPIPQVVSSQATEPATVELDVNMHCEACAEQLKKKILKMKGVQNVETELKSSKVIVTGTMDPESLVEYVYRRTKKQAKIVPQPEPEPAAPAPVAEEKKEVVEKEEKQKGDEPAEGKTEEKTEQEIPSKEGVEHYYDIMSLEEEYMKKMRYMYPPQQQQPLYVVQRLPPAPQMFSDENPNACSIC